MTKAGDGVKRYMIEDRSAELIKASRTRGIEVGRFMERSAIVAWLRNQPGSHARLFASVIAAGDHVRELPQGEDDSPDLSSTASCATSLKTTSP